MRDFTYVANVVDANLRAATACGGSGGAFNIACADRARLNQLVQYINEALGTSVEPIYAEPRAGDVKHSLADISAAREAFGYEPVVGWYAGGTG